MFSDIKHSELKKAFGAIFGVSNLLYFVRKDKARVVKPSFSRSKLKYSLNENFFNTWTSQMAYLLGFTFADGNIYKTSLTWDIQKRDIDILKKVKTALRSTYPIAERSASFRLRINNQVFVASAVGRGLLPKKNMRRELPKIPARFLRHFVRGYLDGDGWLALRSERNEVDVGFSNGNSSFLELLNKMISTTINIKSGRVRRKIQITPKGRTATTYQLEYYSSNAIKIARWVYGDLESKDLYLDRKYRKYLAAKRLYDFLDSGTRKVRVIQKKFGKSMKEILNDLYSQQKLDGVRIAKVLGVHSSSIYRWLAKTGTKDPVTRKVSWTKYWL